MLATAVGIDRAIEGQVRRVVAGDDGFSGLDAHLGALGRRRLLIPPIVLHHRAVWREAVVRVGGGAAAAGWQGNAHRTILVAVCAYSIEG